MSRCDVESVAVCLIWASKLFGIKSVKHGGSCHGNKELHGETIYVSTFVISEKDIYGNKRIAHVLYLHLEMFAKLVESYSNANMIYYDS